mgnify:CR=1 FL=1
MYHIQVTIAVSANTHGKAVQRIEEALSKMVCGPMDHFEIVAVDNTTDMSRRKP